MTRSKVLMAGAASAVALALGYVGVSALTSTAFAAGDVATAAKRIDNFRLAPAVVILTQQNGCAASAASASVLQGLKSQYKDKGVEFLMLNSTPANNRD